MFKDKGKDVTQEDIYNECFPPIDSNKLIAEFMGSKHPKYEDMYRLPHADVYVGELQYDSSWDWLMPVVQKIGDEYLNTPFDETYSHLTEQYENIWTIEDTYNAVIKFIKDHNNGKD